MKCVFLTGATGVLGSALAPVFAESHDTRLILLLRAESERNLEHRLTELLAYWDFNCDDPSVKGRIEAVRGDVSAPNLGMDVAQYDRLSNTVTHIVHAAGNVKLNQSLHDARKSAVDSAKNIVDLAVACQQKGQFRKLEAVSTVGVAGATPGLIEERPFNEPRQFRNTYEAAKAEAEWVVWSAMLNGLCGTIHRPSMIVGDSKTGKIREFQVFYHLADFLAGIKTWGIVPVTGESKLDIIPVDYVARAIRLSSCIPETAGKILHLCSGPTHSWTLNELTKCLRQLLEGRGFQLPRLRRIPSKLARRLYHALGHIIPTRKRRFLQGLPFFLDYLEVEQMFDNSKTDACFALKGLKIPAVDTYFDIVMKEYWNAKLK